MFTIGAVCVGIPCLGLHLPSKAMRKALAGEEGSSRLTDARYLPSDTNERAAFPLSQPTQTLSVLRQPELVPAVVSWHQVHCMGTSPAPRVTTACHT